MGIKKMPDMIKSISGKIKAGKPESANSEEPQISVCIWSRNGQTPAHRPDMALCRFCMALKLRMSFTFHTVEEK